jgi:hypothetical protein
MAEQIFEPVEVIGRFERFKFKIIKFKWREEVYHVSQINSYWKEPTGNNYTYHYSLTCEKQNMLCELSFDLNNFRWELVQFEVI